MRGATAVRARVGRLEIVGLALLAYVPFLLSSPGKISADTKQYLYLDPGRLLSRASSLWDAHVGAGTVPHQNIGYLFPMGPYYWLMDQVGVPDWIAQRLWLGTISFAAGAGVLWLFKQLGVRRSAAVAGALVYMLTPYQLAFTARLSVILLPWAALPWLVGLTIRALARGGWRDPALFALVALASGSVSAPSLLLVGIAPVLWLLFAVIGRRASPRTATLTAGRIGLLSAGVSLWWAIGLLTQARYGIPILDVTETLQTVARSSSPPDILRGLGNWFLSGGDRLGPWLDQSTAYAGKWLAVTTFAIPALALAAAAVVRWRHRAYFVGLVVVGTIVGVGAWPYDDPSALGGLFKDATHSSFGLALRNTPRVVPIIVLGVAGLLAAGISAVAGRKRLEIASVVMVGALAIVSFWPVWQHGYLSKHLYRPEAIPGYWTDAAAALDKKGDATRVLEIPGSLFAAYRWGNTVDPITPGLTDRPWLGRELLPFGSRASVDLLVALDRRMQEGTFEPSSLAPIARLFRSGTVLVRSDLEYERYDTPRPRLLWSLVTDPSARGLGSATGYGPGRPNQAAPSLAMFDELELRSSGLQWPPEVALIPVKGAPTIVSTAPQRRPVVLAGDGEGIVDSAAAGLLDGRELVLYSASLDHAQLQAALHQGADLVVTDTNRRRARRWSNLRDNTGATERAGQRPLREDVNDYRLDPFPNATDKDRTVAEQLGARVDATGYGFTGVYLPEDRPAQAFDGDPRTAWRTAGGEDPIGQRLIVRPSKPVHTGTVTLVQPLTAPNGRWLTHVRLHFDHGKPVDVRLDEGSRTAAGQVVRFPPRTIRRLEIELTGATTTGFDPVGFSEVRLGDVHANEVIRVPVALLDRAGTRSLSHRLSVVLTRLRYEPSAAGRQDEELALVRRLQLPDARTFSLAGTARVDPNAPDQVIDSVLGTTTPGVVITSSGHLAGDADARASRAFDGDLASAWTAPIGPQEGQWIELDTPNPVTLDSFGFGFLRDGRHSVPTRIQLVVDGTTTRSIAVPPIGDKTQENASSESVLRFPSVTGKHFRVVIESTRPVTKVGDQPGATVIAPVAITDVLLPSGHVVSDPPTVPDACRNDLLTVDGAPLSIRVTGRPADARRGLSLEPCGAPLDLSNGSHVIRAKPGLDTGIDLDRLVFTSARGGAAATKPLARVGAPPPSAGAGARVVRSGSTSFDVSVKTDGRPFWLVLGQSDNDGWHAQIVGGRSLGAPRLVNGFANGWEVNPSKAGTLRIEVRWTPQRLVWPGLAISALVALACIGIVVAARRRAFAARLADDPVLASPFEFTDGARAPGARLAVGAAIATGVAAALVSRPWIGAIVAIATFVATRVRGARIVLTVGSPVALVIAKVAGAPELGWLAVLLLGADLVGAWVATRGGDRAPVGR